MPIASVGDISYQITYKKVKRVNLRVRADGSVHVSAPRHVSTQQIAAFVSANLDWIQATQLEKELAYQSQTQRWHDGGIIRPWGEERVIRVVRDVNSKAASFAEVRDLDGEGGEHGEHVLLVHVSKRTSEKTLNAEVKRVTLAWLDEQMAAVVPAMIVRHETRMGVKSSGWHLRRMTSRWGSCNVKTHEICLNSILVERPLACLESVVVHELCHLIEANHSKRFYALMDTHYPNWSEARRFLKSHPPIR